MSKVISNRRRILEATKRTPEDGGKPSVDPLVEYARKKKPLDLEDDTPLDAVCNKDDPECESCQ